MSAILPGTSRARNPKMLDQVRDVLRRQHFSLRTEQAYVGWLRRFILFHAKRHPREMAEQEVTEFLTHLAREGLVAASTQKPGTQRGPCDCRGQVISDPMRG